MIRRLAEKLHPKQLKQKNSLLRGSLDSPALFQWRKMSLDWNLVCCSFVGTISVLPSAFAPNIHRGTSRKLQWLTRIARPQCVILFLWQDAPRKSRRRRRYKGQDTYIIHLHRKSLHLRLPSRELSTQSVNQSPSDSDGILGVKEYVSEHASEGPQWNHLLLLQVNFDLGCFLH